MNGFMLLVLVVLAGQVSPGGLAMPPSANPVQPASMLTTPPPQTDYGWIIDKDNALVFIVQISPDKEAIMKKANQVLESEIPPVVAARIKRVIVRFGNDVIEPTPLEEVEKLPLVYGNALAADLPTGQMRTLENNNGYALQNVAGGSQPPPLSPGGLGMSLADAASSLSDKVNEAIQDPSSLLAQNRTNPAASPGLVSCRMRWAIAVPPARHRPIHLLLRPIHSECRVRACLRPRQRHHRRRHRAFPTQARKRAVCRRWVCPRTTTQVASAYQGGDCRRQHQRSRGGQRLRSALQQQHEQ